MFGVSHFLKYRTSSVTFLLLLLLLRHLLLLLLLRHLHLHLHLLLLLLAFRDERNDIMLTLNILTSSFIFIQK